MYSVAERFARVRLGHGLRRRTRNDFRFSDLHTEGHGTISGFRIFTPKDTERFQVFGSSSVQSVSSVAERSVNGVFRGRALCAGSFGPRITPKDTERFQVVGSSSVQSVSSVAESSVSGVFHGRALCAGPFWPRIPPKVTQRCQVFGSSFRAIRVVRG